MLVDPNVRVLIIILKILLKSVLVKTVAGVLKYSFMFSN